MVTAEALSVAIGRISLLAFFLFAIVATTVGHYRGIRLDRRERRRAGSAPLSPDTR